ncbi:MAG: hypothetical protein H6606_00010 [Flavobacteriales bacterium]|nr:hypothetical protein [Flavobacteriales bacterium]
MSETAKVGNDEQKSDNAMRLGKVAHHAEAQTMNAKAVDPADFVRELHVSAPQISTVTGWRSGEVTRSRIVGIELTMKQD